MSMKTTGVAPNTPVEVTVQLPGRARLVVVITLYGWLSGPLKVNWKLPLVNIFPPEIAGGTGVTT